MRQLRSPRGAALGLEIALAALLLAAAGIGLWQLNRPLSGAAAVTVAELPETSMVLDARGPLAYRRAHLPGARHLWARDLLAFEGETPGALRPPAQLAETLRRLGLEPGTPVVVYDQGDARDAPLVTLLLRGFGLDAYLLHGGLDGWLERGGATTADTPPPAVPSRATFRLDERLLVDAVEARRHLAENAVAPLDARDAAAYAERHIDGAVHLDAATLLPGGELPRWSELRGQLTRTRMTRDTHPLIYGADAAQAARAWLALAAWGVPHLHVYAGPFEGLEHAGLPVSQTPIRAATSERTNSVCWR